MKQYRVKYSLLTASGARFCAAIVYDTVQEVCDAIAEIESIGYEFLGVDYREKDENKYLDEGWK